MSAAPRSLDLLVDEAGDGRRLDVWLAGQEGIASRSSAARLVEAGAVGLNGATVTAKSERLALGDRVSVRLASPTGEDDGGTLPAVPIPLDIRYEDDEGVVVLSKQAGLVCHPSPGHEADTLANALVARYGAGLGMLQGDERPGIVHRLDRDTTGLMLAARTDEAQRALQDLIRLRELDRRYVTLVQGYVAPETGLIDVGIARSRRDRQRMAASDGARAREAITTFRTLERFEAGSRDEGYSLLECHLYTGRTHQIRVHMAHINHPVVGDPVYGTGDARRNLGLDRQFLHSWRLSLTHPLRGEGLAFEDPLPRDLADVLRGLSERSLGRTGVGEEIVPRLLAERPSGAIEGEV